MVLKQTSALLSAGTLFTSARSFSAPLEEAALLPSRPWNSLNSTQAEFINGVSP